MNVKMNFLWIALIFVSVLSSAAEASRLEDEPPTAKAHFADLNLKSQAGIEVLYGRIKHAARRVCDVPQRTRMIGTAQAVKKC
jgi:UrcA family protein